MRGLFTDPTTLTFDRDLAGQQLDLTWYLVEFTDATTVQQGSADFTSSATVRNVAISTIDITRSLAASGYFMRGGKSPYAGGDNPGVAWVTTELTSDTLTITRNFTGSSVADIGYAVVSFDAPNTGPPVVTSAIPDTTVDEDAPLDNYVDLNVVFTDPDEGSALIFSIESNSNPGLLTASIDADSAPGLESRARSDGQRYNCCPGDGFPARCSLRIRSLSMLRLLTMRRGLSLRCPTPWWQRIHSPF